MWVGGVLNELLAEGLFTAKKNPRPNVLRAVHRRVSREESIGIHYFLLSFFWGGGDISFVSVVSFLFFFYCWALGQSE